jgi:hypothetical protein
MTTEPFNYTDGWYVQSVPEQWQHRLKSWTAYCASADTPRGVYDEEIDVRALGPASAKRIVQAVLDRDYQPGTKPRRLVRRPDGFLFT